MHKVLSSRWTKPFLFLLCLVPLLLLGWRYSHDELGANPIELITHATGDWAMRFLLITLAVTPLSKAIPRPMANHIVQKRVSR